MSPLARARCISIIITCEHLPARKAQLFGLWFAAACFLLFSPCLLLAAVLICFAAAACLLRRDGQEVPPLQRPPTV